MYRTHNSTRFMSRDQILFQKQLKGLSPKPLQLHNLLVLCSHLFGIIVSSIKRGDENNRTMGSDVSVEQACFRGSDADLGEAAFSL